MRSLILAGFLAGAAFVPLAFAQDPAPVPAYDAATVVATVNGQPITLGNVIVMRERLPEQYQNLPDDTLLTGIVQQLVDQSLLANTVSTEAATDPMTVKLHLENERRGALAGIVAERLTTAPVEETAIKAAYDKEVANFKPVPEFEASHILVATEEEAGKLLAEIRAGADFAEIAKANSTDGSAAQGGQLGWFSTGQMVPEFEAAVVALEPGAVAGPVKTQFGWHLVKLNAKRDTAPPPLEDVRAEIEGQLRQAAFKAELEKLRAANKIELLTTAVPAKAIREADLVAK